MRFIGWFSGGVTSAVAIKKVIELGHEVYIFYFETGNHHKDHQRFILDCEKWYNQKILTLRNKKYKDVFDVIRKTKFINSPNGARCTKELKKEMRVQVEKIIDYDYQIFGFEYDIKQINRAIRFQEQYATAKATFPLIELGLTKSDCMKSLELANIDLPAMYNLGYNNSNCIGCVKGGAGYWNKIKIDFPEQFDRMAKLERDIGNTCLKSNQNGKSRKLYLDELSLGSGRHKDISLPECGVVCPVELDGLKEIYNPELLVNRIF